MPLFAIPGTFRILGASPDGDSVRFYPDDLNAFKDAGIAVRTNASGIAVAPAFTANGTTGGYIVKATVQGAAPAAFALVNQPSGQ